MATLTDLPGIGPELEKKLHKAGIHKPLDLLFHLPRGYQDRTRLHPLDTLRAHDHVYVQAIVRKCEITMGRRRMMLCHLSDGHGYLILRFFHFYPQQRHQLQEGTMIRCFGEVRQGNHFFEMIHPEYRVIHDDKPPVLPDTLTPVYPAVEGVPPKKLTTVIHTVLTQVANHPELDVIPTALREQYHLDSLTTALQSVHSPTPQSDRNALLSGNHPAQQRLAFEELLTHRISLRQRRETQRVIPATPLPQNHQLSDKLFKLLPFKLTGAQQRVINEIKQDLSKPAAMMRLVQGDVGCGKTLVALVAMLQAVATGKQAALMAPTEILAEQHFNNLSHYAKQLGLNTAWLASKLGAKQRREALAAMADGSVQIICGTHALFQNDIVFNDLALVVIDEQHRFGVEQRLALQRKGEQQQQLPHQLIMTATPIPRTLAMTLYADLDISVIDELPPGRKPIQTSVIGEHRRDEVIQRIAEACHNGRQAYWVCTLIEESETLTCQAAEDAQLYLQQHLPALKISLVHGRMKSAEKQAIMQSFKQGDCHILVATTVIEVGVDVPNASVMVIENAERLGLSQLHQLRGRVGRGTHDSYCVLMYQSPLSQRSRQRLQVMRETNDGFKIAEADLELRGPGEVMGTRQTGDIGFRIADLARDQALLPQVQTLADKILHKHPEAAACLIKRWLGEKIKYRNA